MQPIRFAAIFVLILLVSGFVFGQNSPTETKTTATPEKSKARLELEAKALELAESAVSDANSLKLWENRALIFALAGDLLWETDQKRARVLFRNAANELNLGDTAPKEKPKDYYDDYNYWLDFSPRHTVLLIVATYDADAALEYLKETRPDALQVAIEAQNQPQNPNAPQKTQVQLLNDQKNRFQIQRELELEQNFAVKAAEQNPAKAAKLIRESLKKGVSNSVLSLLRKVNEKDEKLAKELLGEVIRKMLDADFVQDENTFRTAALLLHQSLKEEKPSDDKSKSKSLKPEAKDLQAIANKIADYFTKNLSFRNFWSVNQYMSALEKYAPEKIALLKQKVEEFNKLIPAEQRGWQEVQKLVQDANTKPETLIDEAGKYTGYEQFQLYRAAADKFFEAGQGAKARELIQNTPQSKQRDDVLKYIDEKLSAAAIKDNKLEDVQKIIAKADSNSSKVKLLVDLAMSYENKKTEDDHETALKLMEDARRLVADFPDSNEAVADILKLASGYAVIAPEKSFSYLSNLIEMTNDLLTAKSLLAKYNRRNFAFKQGELIFMTNIPFSATTYVKDLVMLAASDFGRTKGLIDSVRRDDARVLMKILLAQSILKGKISVEGAMNFYYEEY